MIASGINAILIKVACYGLEPEKHLGKTIKEMKAYLVELEKEFGANVCGEGGEYETFTLDCPLFTKRIVIDHFDVKIHSNDAFAKVGYLIKKSAFRKKTDQIKTSYRSLKKIKKINFINNDKTEFLHKDTSSKGLCLWQSFTLVIKKSSLDIDFNFCMRLLSNSLKYHRYLMKSINK
ncbi:diphthine--ammonia ligase isoform X1 [Brachionus plicatilis]|uniref:Diphthine--ammonia ligase n=1 Tax=Brachionus plicatilis TaxID=10195 RepID=A0A3M7QC60_BRAPC|nr:diphthine--ammonia ligase isoform X1 [Brachionus plicatilis]